MSGPEYDVDAMLNAPCYPRRAVTHFDVPVGVMGERVRVVHPVPFTARDRAILRDYLTAMFDGGIGCVPNDTPTLLANASAGQLLDDATYLEGIAAHEWENLPDRVRLLRLAELARAVAESWVDSPSLPTGHRTMVRSSLKGVKW